VKSAKRALNHVSRSRLAARAPNGLPPVVKSRICVASLRCSSVKYVEYSPSSRLGPLATAQFHSVRQTVRCSSGGRGHLRRAPQYGRGLLHDVRLRRVLDTPPPYMGLRRVCVHALPRNIRSSRGRPEAGRSRVFSFEAIPFGLRIVPALAVVQMKADVASLLHVRCQQADRRTNWRNLLSFLTA
jgi:hypothetical protein